jgi:hypothetical protein
LLPLQGSLFLNFVERVLGGFGRSAVSAINSSGVQRVGDEESKSDQFREKLGVIPAIALFFTGYFVAGVGWWGLRFRCRRGRDCALWATCLVIGILVSLWGGWNWLIVGHNKPVSQVSKPAVTGLVLVHQVVSWAIHDCISSQILYAKLCPISPAIQSFIIDVPECNYLTVGSEVGLSISERNSFRSTSSINIPIRQEHSASFLLGGSPPPFLKCVGSYLDPDVRADVYSRRFPEILVMKRPREETLVSVGGIMFPRHIIACVLRTSRFAGWRWKTIEPHVRSFITTKMLLGIRISRFRSSSTAISGFDGSLGLVSGGNLFSPLAHGHIPIEHYGKKSKPFHRQPYPVTSLGAVVFGLALGFCAFWLMHESNHFYFGLFLLLISTCIFVYGLNGIFDVMEINTQRRESFPRLSQEPFGEVDELASNVIHLYQVSSPAVIGPLMNFIVFRTVGRSPGAEVHRAKDGAIGVPGNVLISENTVDDQHAIESSDTLNILRVHWTPRDERCEVYGPLGRIPV